MRRCGSLDIWLEACSSPRTILLFSYVEVRARTTRSSFGILWLIVPNLTFALCWEYLNLQLIKSDSNSLIYVFSGLIFWQLISNSLSQSTVYYGSRRYILDISRFKTPFLALSLVVQNLIVLVIQIPLLVFLELIHSSSDLRPLKYLAILGVLVFVTPLLVMVCYLVTVLGVLRANLTQFVVPTLQAVFILSPIFWKEELVDEASSWTYFYNPFFAPVYLLRSFVMNADFPLPQFLLLSMLTLFFAVIVLTYSSRFEQKMQMRGD